MSKARFAAALVAAFLLLFVISCSKANAPSTATDTSKPQGAPATQTTPAATPGAATSALKIDLKVNPAEPNPSKPAKFDAKITDADGKPVSGADVNVSLVMKTMDMGKNEFKLADKGNGDYQGEGKFGMSGDWDAVVTAKQGDKTATQHFAVKSVMPKP